MYNHPPFAQSNTSYTNVSVATKTTTSSAKKSPTAKRSLEPRFQLSAGQLADLQEAFDMLDTDSTGCIAASDLKVAISALGFEPTKEEILQMLADVDAADSGRLSYDEFVRLMKRKMAAADSDVEIRKAFRLFDADGRGRITAATLRRVADEMGETINDEELGEMIAEADGNKKGYVDEEDFVRVVKKTSLM